MDKIDHWIWVCLFALFVVWKIAEAYAPHKPEVIKPKKKGVIDWRKECEGLVCLIEQSASLLGNSTQCELLKNGYKHTAKLLNILPNEPLTRESFLNLKELKQEAIAKALWVRNPKYHPFGEPKTMDELLDNLDGDKIEEFDNDKFVIWDDGVNILAIADAGHLHDFDYPQVARII